MTSKASLDRSSGDEANLPLYEEFQVSEGHGDVDALPPPSATPDEVRDFLAQLLTTKRNLPQDQVRRIVAKWTIGTGIELRSYPASMFLDIFGREDGWIMYREVRLVVVKAENGFWHKHGHWVAVAVLLCIIAVAVIVKSTSNNNVVQTIAIFTVIIASIPTTFTLMLACALAARTPEKEIDSALAAAMTSRTNGAN